MEESTYDELAMSRLRFAEDTSPTLPEDGWLKTSDEGQLPVDVLRHGQDLVIRSTVAGVLPEDLEVSVNGDLLTIRGKRELSHEVKDDDWFHKECYWGAFSRSLILPMDVQSGKTQASLKHGVLEIRIPLAEAGRNIPIRITD